MKVSIGSKLIIGLTIITLISIIIGLFSIVAIQRMENKNDILYRKMTISLKSLSKMVEKFHRARVNVYAMLGYTFSSKKVNFYKNKFYLHMNTFEKNMVSFRKSELSEKFEHLIRRINNKKQKYLDFFKNYIQLIKTNQIHSALKYEKIGHNTAQKLQGILNTLVILKNNNASQVYAKSQTIANDTILLIIITSIIGLIIALWNYALMY